MNIVDMQRHSDALERRFHILRLQREVLEALRLVTQQLFDDDDTNRRCLELERKVAAQMLQNCWSIWDLSAPPAEVGGGAVMAPESGATDEPPF